MLTASAPGKVILLGEHAVNRSEAAIAAAVDVRARCRGVVADRPGIAVSAGGSEEHWDPGTLDAFRTGVDALRAASDLPAIRALARDDFLAPLRYALAALAAEMPLPPLALVVESAIVPGAGLGSGAAVAAAAVAVSAALAEATFGPAAAARLAWQGDVVAHGGVASALDASACCFGGVVRYSLDGGAEPLAPPAPLRLVVADTGKRADTGEVNARVRAWEQNHAGARRTFGAIGELVREAEQALAAGDLETTGRLMLLDQLLLARIGVSTPEIDSLVDTALDAGALGAKLSGSGGGGIVIALCPDGAEAAVADAMRPFAGRVLTLAAGVPGVQVESTQALTEALP